MIILDLIYNLAVLVALSVFSGFIDQRFNRSELNGKIFQGLLFGITAVIGMLYPFVLTEGIIFDGRSIIISLCTFFFGPISGVIATLITIVFRIYLGGAGVLMGTLVALSSFVIGLIFYFGRYKKSAKPFSSGQLYFLGLIVHAIMLTLVLSLPSKMIVETYKALTFSIIGIYPLVTVLIGKILIDQENNQNFLRQIKESEEKYRILVENQTDLIVKTDADGRFLFINSAYCNLFDVKEGELLRKSYTPLVHEDDIPVVEKEVQKLFKPPYNCSYEERAKTRFGWRWIHWEAKSVLDENGNVKELIGTGRDITDRKNAEIALNRRLEFEKTLAAISSRFINVAPELIENEINNALQRIGEIASVDRTYLFKVGEDGLYINAANEWCAEGIQPQINKYQNVPVSLTHLWIQKLNKLETIFIPRVADLPELMAAEKKTLEEHGIKSVIVIPIIRDEKLAGFIGFDSVKEERTWADEDIILLKMLGEILSNALNRMKSKEALKKLLEKQSAMLLAIPDMIFTVTRDGIIIDHNTPETGTLLASPEEFLNKHISSFLSKELSNEFLSVFKKTISEKKVQQLEYSLLSNDQTKFFEARIAPAGNDRLVVIIRNITEQNRAKKELTKLNRAIEQSSISVIITDSNGNIEYVNPFFTKLTGYTPEEIMGKNPRILKSGHHSADFYMKLWSDIKSGKDWQGEILNKRKNGETYWEYTVISPILDKDGNITNYVAIQEDITQLKLIMEDLIDAKNKAEEMNRIKSLFFANMSHELRTPMIGILGNAELLEMDITDATHREMVRTIYRSAMRLHETLNSILDISKIEVEGIKKTERLIDINNLVEESISLFRAAAFEKGLDVKYENSAEAKKIYTDDNIVTKILNNLLSNAIKYSDSGTITVRLSCNEQKAAIEVEDTGIGIAEDNLDIIFEPFRQTSEGYSRKYEGTGLGLTITKRFVEVLGGTIKVKSVLGKGSTFTVEIPTHSSGANTSDLFVNSAEKPVTVTEVKNNIKLLLVEDEIVNAEVILRLLKEYYSIDWAQNAKDGILKALENNYDAVLMDIGLRGEMDGLDAAREIRKLSNYNSVPIIAVTAYAMEGDKERFLENGCTHYIAKPFQKNELIRTIESALAFNK
jgi:PAS domain S-box-containing protein